MARKAKQIQAPGEEKDVWADLVENRSVVDQVQLGRKARSADQAVQVLRDAGYRVITAGGYANATANGFHVTAYRRR